MMNPIQAVGVCLRKYFVFSGRASRSEYWWFSLMIFTASWLVAALDGLEYVGTPETIYYLATFFPSIAALTRRLHDTGRSGWHVLVLLFAPTAITVAGNIMMFAGAHEDLLAIMGIGYIVGGVYFLLVVIWCIFPSNPGENKYGPHPFSEAS